MNGPCDGKVALVTGTSRGLGKAIAHRLAGEGATVALTARTMDPDPKYQGSLRQTLEDIEASGGAAIAIQADLSKPRNAIGSSARWSNVLAHLTFWSTTPLSRFCARSMSFRIGGCG